MKPLTDEEFAKFEYMREVPPQYLPLVRAQLDGKDVAVIAASYDDGNAVNLEPLAVLVNDEILSRLTPPEG